ncbi:MAG: helix-turn-helix transcriptional regulator [Finegoldia sp.]|nr:helix-turn-helix transcriptional regulator [Finegoldia sp.]
MEKINNTKTEKLKEERIKNGLTYSDMAEKLGYKSKTSYMNIEKGFVNPSIDTMNKISEILKKPVQYFFNLKVQDNWI